MDRTEMLFPGGKKKAFTLSYDDGREFDARLSAMFDKYGVKATFNLNSTKLGTPGYIKAEDIPALYPPRYAEVATHGAVHAFLNAIPAHAAFREIDDDRQALEKLTGAMVRGHAYPYGAYNDTVIEILKNAGVAYARTVNSTHALTIPEDWYRWDPSCHHDDPMLGELADRLINAPAFVGPQLLYVWGHSYEFDGKNNWDAMEKFLGKIGGRDDIWYATNIEIHDYVRAFRALLWSADCSRVKNPTSTEVWLSVGRNGAPVRVAPGAEASV